MVDPILWEFYGPAPVMHNIRREDYQLNYLHHSFMQTLNAMYTHTSIHHYNDSLYNNIVFCNFTELKTLSNTQIPETQISKLIWEWDNKYYCSVNNEFL
jgi:hypothetical protein